MSPRLLFACAAMLLLAACQTAGQGGGGGSVSVPGAAGEITVTPLDAPGAGAAATTGTADAVATGGGEAVPQMAADELVPAAAKDTAVEDPVTPEVTDADTTEIEAPAVPEAAKSASQIACEKKGGVYANAGSTGAKVCVKTTRDGGKSCDREGDCEGLCLARSRTCSPVTPVFGCQEILQQDGLQVTQCTE